MKIACTPVSVRSAFKSQKLTQRQYFEFIGAHGAEATDLMDPECYPWFWQDQKEELQTLALALRQTGLKISAYATGNNFAQPDNSAFAREVEKVIRAIHAAEEVGTNLLRIFGGYHQAVNSAMGGIDYANGLELVRRGIEAVLPEAEKCGVKLALENHGRLPGLSPEILYLMEYFSSPSLGICFDIANFLAHNMNETEDPLHAYASLQKYIKHVHFKDWKVAPWGAAKRVMPAVCGSGDGMVPLRQIAYLLERDRFPGYCSLESELPDLDGIGQSLDYMLSLKKSAALLYTEGVK